MSSGWRERLYAASPHWTRDLFVTLVGRKLARQRFGGRYLEFLAHYAALDGESAADARARQERLFVEFAAFARQRSPFYREFWKDAPSPASLDDITRLPRLGKEELRANLHRLPTGPATPDMAEVHTSGTTGTPMSFRFTPDDLRARYAILDHYRSWFGVRNGDRRATFSGRIVRPEGDGSNVFWQTNHALHQRLYSTYHLSPENLPRYVEDLERFAPEFLDGYPSALSVVARFMLARGIRLSRAPKAVFATAETLTAAAEDELALAFECPVGNQYSSSEGAPYVVSCERGSNHVLTYSGVIEVLDDDGRPADTGEMVVTCFHTHHMPLVRYRIGDHLSRGAGTPCGCGRAAPRVERILGRAEDYVVSSTRGLIGRLDPVFKGLPPSIIRSQIVQHRIDEVELLYVADPARFQPAHLDSLRHELEARLGGMTITMRAVDDLPLGPHGKFKAVVCTVPPEAVERPGRAAGA